MLINIIIIFCLVMLIANGVSYLLSKRKPKIKAEPGNEPKYSITTDLYYLADTENADRVYKYHREDLEENDEYHRSAKELKEDYDHEKVWKYEPLELPFKLEGREVYTELDGEWAKVGRLKKTADIEGGELKLYLYPNEYKYVTEDSVEKEKGEHYFRIECRKKKEYRQSH